MALASTTPGLMLTEECLSVMDDDFASILTSFAQICHQLSVNAGWYQNPKTGEMVERNVPEMLALIHSEVSEALEGHRKNSMDEHLPNRKAIEVELADAIIRIGDLAGCLKLDIGGAIVEKIHYNTRRADHTLAVRAAEGGKEF